MKAAVYSDVILSSGQWDCETCSHNPAEWARRGKCIGPVANGVEELPITILRKGQEVSTAEAYPAEFVQCPRGLLRADLFPHEVTIAALATQAVRAEVKHRWPDVPAKLWSLAIYCEDLQTQRKHALESAYYAQTETG